uniref:Protein kinase domain-containing protein n=1 Tax=Anopheles epiroticus TaxID=199890 RepID=A0A182PN42_9DIPT
MDPAQHTGVSPAQRGYGSTAIGSIGPTDRLLPPSVDRLPPEGRDLLQRLLRPDPRERLRSLLQLQRIALYQHYRWDDVRNRKIRPRDLFDDQCLLQEDDILFTDF